MTTVRRQPSTVCLQIRRTACRDRSAVTSGLFRDAFNLRTTAEVAWERSREWNYCVDVNRFVDSPRHTLSQVALCSIVKSFISRRKPRTGLLQLRWQITQSHCSRWGMAYRLARQHFGYTATYVRKVRAQHGELAWIAGGSPSRVSDNKRIIELGLCRHSMDSSRSRGDYSAGWRECVRRRQMALLPPSEREDGEFL